MIPQRLEYGDLLMSNEFEMVLTSMVTGVLSPLARLNERRLSLVDPLVDLPKGWSKEIRV